MLFIVVAPYLYWTVQGLYTGATPEFIQVIEIELPAIVADVGPILYPASAEAALKLLCIVPLTPLLKFPLPNEVTPYFVIWPGSEGKLPAEPPSCGSPTIGAIFQRFIISVLNTRPL